MRPAAVDRWCVMTLQLLGKPTPAPPAIRGRTYRAPRTDDTDPGLADMQAAALWRGLASDNEQDTAS